MSVYNIINVIKDAVTGKLTFASKPVIATRRDICRTCEVRHNALNVCTACGCYIPAKTALEQSTCPLEFW